MRKTFYMYYCIIDFASSMTSVCVTDIAHLFNQSSVSNSDSCLHNWSKINSVWTKIIWYFLTHVIIILDAIAYWLTFSVFFSEITNNYKNVNQVRVTNSCSIIIYILAKVINTFYYNAMDNFESLLPLVAVLVLYKKHWLGQSNGRIHCVCESLSFNLGILGLQMYIQQDIVSVNILFYWTKRWNHCLVFVKKTTTTTTIIIMKKKKESLIHE